jgi:membrane-bound ClpP family serine protease
LRWLEGSRLGKAFFLGKAVSGSSNPPIAPDEVVGMEGKAATPLKPEGIIAIGDERYDAFCEDGYASKGTALSVSGKDGYRLKVRKL